MNCISYLPLVLQNCRIKGTKSVPRDSLTVSSAMEYVGTMYIFKFWITIQFHSQECILNYENPHLNVKIQSVCTNSISLWSVFPVH